MHNDSGAREGSEAEFSDLHRAWIEQLRYRLINRFSTANLKEVPYMSAFRAASATLAGLTLAAGLTTAPLAHAQPAPQITWEPCPVQVTVEGAECGHIDVPMRYTDPAGPQISLGFVRTPAKNPSARRGTIFGNPGGPGGDAYSYFGSESLDWPEEIRNEWDLVAVQPRGLRGSTALNCASADVSTPANAAKAKIESLISFGGLTRSLCQGDHPGYPETITTENNARDWDMVRQALGEQQISIIGLSYGTYLGSTYATLFPQHTDRVVLDSAMNPDTQWTRLLADQTLGYERALHDYFAWVAANNATYGMGDTPLKAYQYWSNVVVAQSGTNPTSTPPPARIGDLPPGLEFTGQAGADVMTATGKLRVEGQGIVSRMLNPGASQANSPLFVVTPQLLPIPATWDGLARMTNGTLTEEEQNFTPDPALIEENQAQLLALFYLQNVQLCNENVTPPIYELTPQMLWSDATGDLHNARLLAIASGNACAGAGPVAGKVALDGSRLATRPLQFNATGDPQTVYAGRFGIANPMGSHLVTVHGPGHGHVGYGNPAVDRQVVDYLRTGNLGPVEQSGFFEAR